jgi:hypothetical protein
MSTADDLKLIRGIGPSIESRLHGAGILTFAQLAELSPQELESIVPGLSEKRHRLAGWISEAKDRASGKPQPAPEVERSRRPTRRKPVAKAAEPDATEAAGLGGVLRLQEVQTHVAGQPGPSELLREGQPFTVRAVLDLTGLEARREVLLSYTLRVYANGLVNGDRRIVGEERGTISMTDAVVTIEMEAAGLPKDLYRLTAFVTLTLVAAEGSAPALAASLEKGLLQVG